MLMIEEFITTYWFATFYNPNQEMVCNLYPELLPKEKKKSGCDFISASLMFSSETGEIH